MVERTSEQFNLRKSEGGTQLSALRLGPGERRRPEEVDHAGSQALEGLVGLFGQAAGKMADQQAQMAYLEGSRARMAGQAQETVDSNVFTRSFVNGGYQDQDYRIHQADMAREMDTFIATKGKSMSPAEFQKVVQERAGTFTEQFGELSQRGQMSALTNQTKLEESLFAKQGQAYAQWSIEQGSKAYLAQGNQIITDLQKAGEADAPAQAERAALFFQDVLTTDKLPVGSREATAVEYVHALINNDQRGVVEQFRESGMLNSISFKERQKIDSALRDSKVRTEATDSLAFVQQDGEFEGKVIAGLASTDELNEYITSRTNSGHMSYDQGKQLRAKYIKGLGNKDDMSALMSAVGNRDLTAMAALGYTGQEAIDQMDKQLAAQGISLERRLQVGMTHGLDIGVLPKSFGETIAQSVRAVASSTDKAPVSTDLVEALNGVVSTLTLAEQKNPGARGVLLSSMPKDTQAQMAYVLTQQDKGVAPTQAIKEYATAKEDFAKLDNLQAGMQTNKFKTTVQERIDSEVSSGFFGRIGNALTGNSNLSTNPLHAAQLGAALQDEVSSITSDRNNMGLSPEAALEMAVANVQARTIQVGERGWAGTGEARRSLIMPRGVDLQTVFGSNDKPLIGRMLSQLHPAEATGYESTFQFNRATGQLENIQVDATGVVASRHRVDTVGIGQRIREDNERVFTEAEAAHFGRNVPVGTWADGDGPSVDFRMDGGNTYGIPVKQAYQFRRDIATFESYRDTVYKDRNGLAVGVGHNVTGRMKEGDKISKAQAEAWFREDTDDAMRAGVTLAKQLGVLDGQAKSGLAGAIFQLGERGLGEHTRTAEAIAKKDWPSFVKEVRSSAWHQQTPKRTEWFIQRMRPHFVGSDTLFDTSQRQQ